MTPLQMSKELRRLAKLMNLLGVAMDYHGGLGAAGVHGRELIRAAELVKDWARQIEAGRTARRDALAASVEPASI